MPHTRDRSAERGRSTSPTAIADAPDPDVAPVTALPAYPTRLIGRDADRARLRALLGGGERLVVVTGPGGVGKTRLAVQVATDLAPGFRHGARFLPLASVAPGVDLNAAFAWYLGLQDAGLRSYREVIAEHLATRETLLVVDNAEHVPEIAGLLTFIHVHCPAVAMLVTSRRTLDVYGEVSHQLMPLDHRATGTPDSLRHGEAIALLRERIRAIDPDFAVTPANAADLAAICDHLGGLPLAIELTAPRLARRDAARVLAEMRATEPSPAEASMSATVRLSYDRLDPAQQRAFRALCIMCGWWLLEDALPILPELSELDAIDHLDTLVRSSMLASAAAEGEVRFTINPVLRQFGRGLLDDLGEAPATADRHADRMVRLVEEAEPELTGPSQRWWLGRIESLHDDLRDAHAHLLGHDRAVDALRLATALWRYGYIRGHYREIRRMIETALAAVGDHDALRSRALNGIGLLSIMLRDPDSARAAHEQALRLASPLGLDREAAVAWIGLADLETTAANDIDGALRHLRQAAAAYERLDDARGMATVLTNRGSIEWQRGELDRAFMTHEEAGALFERARDTRGVAWSRTNTGRIAARQGRWHEAVPRLLDGLERYVQIGDVSGIAEVLEALAAVAVGMNSLEAASTLLGAAAATRAGIGSTLSGIDLAERDATLDAVRRGAAHEAAYARGMALGLDAATAMARAFPLPASPAGIMTLRRVAHERFGITSREHEVLVLLGEGLTDQEMADRLGLSVRTIHTHTASLMRRLDVSSRVAAVRVAHQAGILPPPGS